MKKVLMMFVAIFAMTLAANATEYTGTVSNVIMGGTPQEDATGITFDVTGNELTGDFGLDVMHPPHQIDLSANVSTGSASGTVTVYGSTVPFNGTITIIERTDTTLKFYFECPDLNASFYFEGQ